MHVLTGLPDHVVELLDSVPQAEFGTVSSSGVPIDTPMLLFPSDGLRTFDVGTGLSISQGRAGAQESEGRLAHGG